MTTKQALLISLFSAAFLPACASGTSDIASDLVGDYQGELTSNDDVTLDGQLTVSFVDNTHVEINGAGFSAFEVELMSAGALVTNSVEDTETELSWTASSLIFDHLGTDSVQFNGQPLSVDDGEDNDGEDNDGEDGLGDTVSGTYTGIVAGPVNDVDYSLTLRASGVDQVEVSGPGIETFDVPLVEGPDGIEEASNWSEGSFVYSGDRLEIFHDIQSLSFTGDRN